MLIRCQPFKEKKNCSSKNEEDKVKIGHRWTGFYICMYEINLYREKKYRILNQCDNINELIKFEQKHEFKFSNYKRHINSYFEKVKIKHKNYYY